MEKSMGYSARYDAFFDVDTRQWDSGICGDPVCEYCGNRPKTAQGVVNDIHLLRLADHKAESQTLDS